MKRAIIFILTILAMSLIVSCEKSEPTKLDDRLVGTKWQTSDYAYKLVYGGNPYEVYEFVSVTEVECYTINAGSVVRSKGTYTYKLDYPHITINLVSSGEVAPTPYTFKDSRTMVRDNVDESKPYAKYIKQ